MALSTYRAITHLDVMTGWEAGRGTTSNTLFSTREATPAAHASTHAAALGNFMAYLYVLGSASVTTRVAAMSMSVRMLEMIEIDKHKTQALNGKWVVPCVRLHELLGTAIRTFLMGYRKKLKVRTRQHSYGRRLALTRSTSQ